MSLSPFSRNNSSPHNGSFPASASSGSGSSGADAPLTLLQALTITAGLAGLIGLLSGGVIRLSLANSPNAQFLRPSQTFPTLTDWPSAENPSGSASGSVENLPTETKDVFSDESEVYESEVYEPDVDTLSDIPQGEDAVDTEYLREESELNWQTGEDFDVFSSEQFTSTQAPFDSQGSSVPSNFDVFADRGEGRSRAEQTDPLEALSRGPLLRQSLEYESDYQPFSEDERFERETFFEDNFEDNTLEEEGWDADFSDRVDASGRDSF